MELNNETQILVDYSDEKLNIAFIAVELPRSLELAKVFFPDSEQEQSSYIEGCDYSNPQLYRISGYLGSGNFDENYYLFIPGYATFRFEWIDEGSFGGDVYFYRYDGNGEFADQQVDTEIIFKLDKNSCDIADNLSQESCRYFSFENDIIYITEFGQNLLEKLEFNEQLNVYSHNVDWDDISELSSVWNFQKSYGFV